MKEVETNVERDVGDDSEEVEVADKVKKMAENAVTETKMKEKWRVRSKKNR